MIVPIWNKIISCSELKVRHGHGDTCSVVDTMAAKIYDEDLIISSTIMGAIAPEIAPRFFHSLDLVTCHLVISEHHRQPTASRHNNITGDHFAEQPTAIPLST